MSIRLLLIPIFFISFTCGKEAAELPSKEIRFLGQKNFDEDKLRTNLNIKTKNSLLFWMKYTPVIKNRLIPSIKPSLKAFYESEGFYDAVFSIKNNRKKVSVKIDENRPVKIKSLSISSDYDISDFITLRKGDVFKAKEFIAVKQRVMLALLKDGYCSYDLDSKAYVDLSRYKVDIKYILKKGDICKFGKTTIVGLKTIDKDIVESYVAAKEGKTYSSNLIQDTLNNLYGLNAFDSVLVDTNRKIYNVIPVDIKLMELKKPYHFEVGVGYDTYVGKRVHGNIEKNNFLGDAQKIKIGGSWSEKEHEIILDYKKPLFVRIFEYDLDLGVSTGYSNLELEGFTEEKTFLKIFLEHKHSKLKIKSGLAFENIYIDTLDNIDDNSINKAVNEGEFFLFYPYTEIIYDARDSKMNPKYGYYVSLYNELGLSRDSDSSIYIKNLLEARAIYTFSKLTLSAVGKVGTIEDSSTKGLPESKLFFAGGSYSNRAYGYNEMGVIVSSKKESINGASSMVNLSLEANYAITDSISGAIFLDDTKLNENSFDFDGTSITSLGFGVRYLTPIGPLKLDIGYNLSNKSQYGIVFQIGQSF